MLERKCFLKKSRNKLNKTRSADMTKRTKCSFKMVISWWIFTDYFSTQHQEFFNLKLELNIIFAGSDSRYSNRGDTVHCSR